MSLLQRSRSAIGRDKEEENDDERLAMVTKLKAEKQQAQLKEVKELKKQLKNSVPKEEFEIVKNECDQLKLDLLDASSQIQTLTHELAKSKKQCKEKEDKIIIIEQQLTTIKESQTNEIVTLQKELTACQTNLATKIVIMEEIKQEKQKYENQMKEYTTEIQELQRRLHESMQNASMAMKNKTQPLSIETNGNVGNALMVHDEHSKESLWKTRLDELKVQHHIELQRLKKGHELEVAALKTQVHQLKISIQNNNSHNTSSSNEIAKLPKSTDNANEVSMQQEINEQWMNYKAMVEGEINMLRQRLEQFEDGNVEADIHADLEDNGRNRGGLSKKSTPIPSEDYSPPHSRQSSHGSSVAGYEVDGSQRLTSEALLQHAQMNNSDQSNDMDLLQNDNKLSPLANSASNGNAKSGANPNRLHKPASSASESYLFQKSQPNALKRSQTPTQFRASASGGGIAAKDWMNTLRKKVSENFSSSPNNKKQNSNEYLLQSNDRSLHPRSPSHASSHDGSVVSISEIDKYIGVDENGNSKVPEELKVSHEQLRALQHSEHAKYRQMQTSYNVEKKYWLEKNKELQNQILEMEQTLKTTQRKLREKVEQNTLLRDHFQMLQQQLSELPPQSLAKAQERAKSKQQEQIKFRESQQALHNQIEVQRQQMAQMQGTIEQQRFMLEALQKELDQSKEKIKNLERKLEEAQSEFTNQIPSSDKELLQQQVKVLKTQRKVLVKEIQELRSQNNILKNMIVTGRPDQ